MFCKYGSGAMTLEMDRSYVDGVYNIITRNEVGHSGASAGLAISALRVRSTLNRVHHQFAIQEDGGLMQMSGLDIAESPEWNLINEYNWLHDAAVFRSGKWGLRFDRNNKECFGTAELDTSATPDPGPLFAGGAAYVNVKDRKRRGGCTA